MRIQLQNIPAGKTLKLLCPSDGIPTPSIKWYKNENLLNGTFRDNGETVSVQVFYSTLKLLKIF
jgi:hypothetical protein